MATKKITDYDLALEQFQEETDLSEKDFVQKVEEHGYDYVVYYAKRWKEVNQC